MGNKASKTHRPKQIITGTKLVPFGDTEKLILRTQWMELCHGRPEVNFEGFQTQVSLGKSLLTRKLFHMFVAWPCDCFPSTPSARTSTQNSISLKSYVVAVANMIRSPPSNRLKILWQLAMDEKINNGALNVQNLAVLFRNTLELSGMTYESNEGSAEGAGGKDWATRLAEAVLRFGNSNFPSPSARCKTVTFDQFCEFCFAQIPMLHVVVSSFATSRFLAKQGEDIDASSVMLPPSSEHVIPPFPLSDNNEKIAIKAKSGSALFEDVEQFGSALFGLSLQSPSLNGGWKRLYTSSIDGLSFNRLARAVCGYQGPSVMLLQDGKGSIFGIYTSTGWKAANQHSGGDSSNFLFRLTPTFRIISPKSASDRHFQYLNLSGFSLPHGLGVGGERCEVKNFRLFLPEEDLDQCRSRSSCTTFDSGVLSEEAEEKVKSGDEPLFELVTAELWGVGGSAVLANAANSQKMARAVEDANIQRARKVDKASFVENGFDREMFLGKTFSTGAENSRC